MPPYRSKTRHKKVGKEKTLNHEKKASSPGDSKIHCGRRREGKSKSQLKNKESLTEKDDNLEQDPLKTQGPAKESKESGHKELFWGEKAYERNDKKESGVGRKHGEQLVSKLERKKAKACKPQEVTSVQESEDSSDKEEKTATNSKKRSIKRKCGKHPGAIEKVSDSESVESSAVQSVEGSFQKHDLPQKAHNARQRKKLNEDHGIKKASEQKSGSQFQGRIAREKGERMGKKQVGKRTQITVTESAEEKLLETSNNSGSDSSNESHCAYRKETSVDSTASSEEKSNSSEDSTSEKEAMLEDIPVAGGKGSKEVLGESNEASSKTEREQVTTDGRKESEEEGTDFAGLEAEEKKRKQDDMPRHPRSTLAESSEKSDDVSISGSQLISPKNRENGSTTGSKEKTLENDKVQDMSKDASDNSGDSGENSTEGNAEKGKERARRKPLPSAVKAKLPISKVLQGTEQEKKVNDEGSTLEDSPLLFKQQMTLKEKCMKCESAEQGKVVGHIQRDGSSDRSKQAVAAMMLTKKYSPQSQILLNLKSKHKNAETKLLTSCKPNPVQMALESSSELKNVESICSKPTTLQTFSTQKEPNIAQNLGEKRLSLSSVSSCSSIRKISSDKQHLGRKKKVGKVTGKMKLGSRQTFETKKEKAEVVAEAPSAKANVRDGKGSKYLHSTHSNFRKVTTRRGQKPSKKASLKARLLSVARAIGISGWLLKKFGKRKRRSKPFWLRSRMAIRIVSTAGWVGQSDKTCPDVAGQLERGEVSDKGSSPPLAEGRGGPKTSEELGRADLPSGDSPLQGTGSFPNSLSLDEDKNNIPDAKFAIVLPRVHSMVKSKTSSPAGSGSDRSLEKPRALSDRRSVMPVQQGCGFKSDLPRSLMDQSLQRNSEQYSCKREIFASTSTRQVTPTATQCRVTSLLSSLPQQVKTPESAATSHFSTGQTLQPRHKDPHLSLSSKASGNYCCPGFLPPEEEDPTHTTEYSGEVDVKEYSGGLQTASSEAIPCVHWSQQQAQGCDPVAWLNSELLLPQITIKNLSKWAIYRDPHLANSHVVKVCKDQWEAEDISDDMLEMDFMQKQVYMDEDHRVEVEEIEDLTRLEYVLSVVFCN
nr:titin homolog [Anas platyrhynchos]